MSKNDGGPAFPCNLEMNFLGISIRDWFAGMAMQSVLTWKDAPAMPVTSDGPLLHPDVVANWSYCYADAMLRAREEVR